MVVNSEYSINNITFIVNECPSGYGLSGKAKQCELCVSGYYSLLNTTEKCIKCNNKLESVVCNGNNELIINTHFWISIYKFSKNYETYFDLNTKSSKSIVVAQCPPNYCCQSNEGCNYYSEWVNNSESTQLCAFGRDPTVALCGKCLNGYSEVFQSVTCQLSGNDI